MDDYAEILELADELDKAAAKMNRKALDSLQKSAETAAQSFCGSWLGYHSRIYYENLQPAPAGARFDSDWGFSDLASSSGRWGEFPFDTVVDVILEWAGSPDCAKFADAAAKSLERFEQVQAALLSTISRYRTLHPDDSFLETLAKKISSQKNASYSDYVSQFRPKNFLTHDMIAFQQGALTPPHIHLVAQIGTWRYPFILCAKLAKLGRQAGAHIASLEKKAKRSSVSGSHVFIGHGRASVWKDFRDFIRDRIKLPFDEFNRLPVAGIPTATRLMQMLDDAAIAFLILTAEDEQADGKFHPRMNVIHEAGLFQGRLGFSRSIILLEEGCEEFSNSHGVGHIKFPKGNILQAFEEVRRVLEREGLVEMPQN